MTQTTHHDHTDTAPEQDGEQPAWVWTLLAAVQRHEDTHTGTNGRTCLTGALQAVPEHIRQHARTLTA